jgi:hypothetical protein
VSCCTTNGQTDSFLDLLSVLTNTMRRAAAEQRRPASRHGAEMTVLGERLSTHDGMVMLQQRRSAAVADLSEKDGERKRSTAKLSSIFRVLAKMTAEVGRKARCLGVSWRGLDRL